MIKISIDLIGQTEFKERETRLTQAFLELRPRNPQIKTLAATLYPLYENHTLSFLQKSHLETLKIVKRDKLINI